MAKSEIITVDKAMITEIIGKYPQFALDMFEYLSKTIRVFSNQIENMSFLQADKRAALFLLDNLGEKKRVAFTHDEIAGTIGASRVTVSKILGRFAQNGWISTRYKQINIINIEGLTGFLEEE